MEVPESKHLSQFHQSCVQIPETRGPDRDKLIHAAGRAAVLCPRHRESVAKILLAYAEEDDPLPFILVMDCILRHAHVKNKALRRDYEASFKDVMIPLFKRALLFLETEECSASTKSLFMRLLTGKVMGTWEEKKWFNRDTRLLFLKIIQDPELAKQLDRVGRTPAGTPFISPEVLTSLVPPRKPRNEEEYEVLEDNESSVADDYSPAYSPEYSPASGSPSPRKASAAKKPKFNKKDLFGDDSDAAVSSEASDSPLSLRLEDSDSSVERRKSKQIGSPSRNKQKRKDSGKKDASPKRGRRDSPSIEKRRDRRTLASRSRTRSARRASRKRGRRSRSRERRSRSAVRAQPSPLSAPPPPDRRVPPTTWNPPPPAPPAHQISQRPAPPQRPMGALAYSSSRPHGSLASCVVPKPPPVARSLAQDGKKKTDPVMTIPTPEEALNQPPEVREAMLKALQTCSDFQKPAEAKAGGRGTTTAGPPRPSGMRPAAMPVPAFSASRLPPYVPTMLRPPLPMLWRPPQ